MTVLDERRIDYNNACRMIWERETFNHRKQFIPIPMTQHPIFEEIFAIIFIDSIVSHGERKV